MYNFNKEVELKKIQETLSCLQIGRGFKDKATYKKLIFLSWQGNELGKNAFTPQIFSKSII